MSSAPPLRASVLLLLPLIGALAACNGGDKSDDSGTTIAAVGPEMSHEAPSDVLQEGDSLDLSVDAVDSDGVAGVVLYHRTAETDYWDTTYLDRGEGDTWSGSLETVYAPGVEYYFKATDSSPAGAESFLPEEATAAPFLVEVQPLSAGLPFDEDFESEGDEASLFQLDWWTPSDGYDAYPFELTTGNAFSGEQAALHSRGNDGAAELADWLISPALDFSSESEIMITWWEYGATVENTEEHGLYISTGSRLPEDGDFVAVEEALDLAPDGEWGRSAAYDLSDWAGESVVYLAWFYRGSYADDWYIDDVSVRALAPDLDADLSWSPDPVLAGETTTLSITLDNLTSKGADSLSGTLSLPDGGGTLADDGAMDFGGIDAEGSTSGDIELTLDAETPNHSYLPLELELTDGSEVWQFDLSMVVGLPSQAEIDLSLDAAALVRIELGTGDPDDPDTTISVLAESLDAGSHTVVADLTDYYDLLPPGPGDARWFVAVNSSADGSIDDFAISYGGETELATNVPESLSSSDSTDSYLVYLPEPPDPAVNSISPSEAEPGEQVSPSVNLVNDGFDTAGGVTGVLSSVDGDSVVASSDPFTVTADVWAAGESVSVTLPDVTVASEHVDSTTVDFELLLDDGVENWIVDVAIDVPWAVFRVYEVNIADDGGDGVLDPGETAEIEFDIANTGDMDSSGQVFVSAAIASSSTATATISGDSNFGTIAAGKSRDGDFDVVVTGGSDGDTVDIEFTLTDDDNTYTSSTQLVLGEPPWQMLAVTDDEVGDNLGEYDFDFVNGFFRVDGDTAELWLISDTEFDEDTLFIEIWGSSSGTPYSWYRWVIQSGSADVQGYSSGFDTIGAADVDYISSTELVMSWSLTDMDLAVDSISMGLAAGWCGPPEYFCDHFPDNWGYPYDTFSTSGWYSLSW